MDDTISILSSRATELSKNIFGAFNSKRLQPSDLNSYRLAHQVAVKLHLITTYLDSLPPYWVEQEVEDLCCKILLDLKRITQPTRKPSPFNWNKSTDPVTCLVAFFKIQTEHACSFEIACDNLLSMLTANDNGAVTLSDSALQQNTLDMSDGFDNRVFETLQYIAECDPASHETLSADPRRQKSLFLSRHPARLCLHELETPDVGSCNKAILVSAMNMATWQEFYLKIQPGNAVDSGQDVLIRGGFCPVLERNLSARLFLEFRHNHGLSLLKESGVLNQIIQAGPGVSLRSVLSQYKLTSKDKIILSYAVSQSYWNYYDSELMRVKWTSDNIWFMPVEASHEQRDELPLRAYIPLPLDLSDGTEPDVIYADLLNHQCPRIFDLGVLLLEIGLGRPFQVLNRRDRVAQANFNHKRASDELLELEKDNWDAFTHKKYFDYAVKFCLSRENFIPPKQLQQPPRESSSSILDWKGSPGILERRRMLHKHVVRPLAWLAKRGFKAKAGDSTYVSRKLNASPHGGTSDALSTLELDALFHNSIIPRAWLMDLKKINELVERKRREYRVKTPVRVAILDTGFNRDLFNVKARNGLIKSITDEMDFTNTSAPNMIDASGHGTFMARLIMECSPNVEILVARVAENTNALKSSLDNIRKAILWAGQTGKADIISMSFGFPTDDQGICDAIETVSRGRGEDIILFASAGNSPTDNESFPARHPSVISVYATNCHGSFLQSNSASITRGAAVLGTYGDNIPDFVFEELSAEYQSVCQRGSSVATAIMAGIGATMLAYTSVLPSLVSFQGVAASTGNRVLKRLKTSKGMEAVLHRLAQQDSDHPRLKAVKPAWFWKERPSDTQRYCAIVDALSDVDKRFLRTA
ncbi:hypothetical protein NPX13_g6598 [Xylaria arbuscula]|uniref:Peptidase S8/S53 domain-containing protein n=1 Tax=Xylaria arbuscula TaxID=114810 RepID=A0A9W8NCA6_9PEZI|nr:hypothetical protein NPX13_g6598 [Xylaria arbuscula]